MPRRSRSRKPAPRTDWSRPITLNVLRAVEGGPGWSLIQRLRSCGIPARRAPTWCGRTSHLVGYVGIEVPSKFERRACRIAYR